MLNIRLNASRYTQLLSCLPKRVIGARGWRADVSRHGVCDLFQSGRKNSLCSLSGTSSLKLIGYAERNVHHRDISSFGFQMAFLIIKKHMRLKYF